MLPFDTAWQLLAAPFAEFAFMRHALVATLALSLSATPLGMFLTLRRMSLLGDALSQAILPGGSIGLMLFGLSLTAMALGGVVAGLLVVALAGWVSRTTALKEDASLAAIYLLALALGARRFWLFRSLLRHSFPRATRVVDGHRAQRQTGSPTDPPDPARKNPRRIHRKHEQPQASGPTQQGRWHHGRPGAICQRAVGARWPGE